MPSTTVTRIGPGWNAALASVSLDLVADLAVRAEEHLQEIRSADDTHNLAVRVDDREALHPPLVHEASRSRERRPGSIVSAGDDMSPARQHRQLARAIRRRLLWNR